MIAGKGIPERSCLGLGVHQPIWCSSQNRKSIFLVPRAPSLWWEHICPNLPWRNQKLQQQALHWSQTPHAPRKSLQGSNILLKFYRNFTNWGWDPNLHENLCFLCFSMVFGLPHAKPCRIIWKLRQQVISKPETRQIWQMGLIVVSPVPFTPG